MSVRSRLAKASMAFGQDMLEQAAEHLHRHVLEGERRAVKQFLHEQMRFQLHQRRDRRMAEAGISLVADFRQRLERNGLSDELAHHPRGEVRICQAAHRSPVRRSEHRPGFRHKKTTVLGQAREQHSGEIAGGRVAAGGDVTHGVGLAHGQAGAPAGWIGERPAYNLASN
jgi:hypothetical protein